MRDLPYPLLIRSLPEVFRGRIPQRIVAATKPWKPQPWELAEEGVHWLFRYHLALPSEKLGSNRLFEHEPEGLVGGLGPEENRIMIYECKSRKEPYRMLHDDLLRYQDYIREKRKYAKATDRRLTSFLLIAPAFAGQLNGKLNALSEDGVNASAVTPEPLVYLYVETEDWPLAYIRLIDPCRFLHTGLIRKPHISNELDRVRDQYGPPPL